MTDRAEAFKALKSQLKLDLNAPPAASKLTAQQQQSQNTTDILDQILKSPEFERISRDLAQSFQMATPTPTKLLNPQPWEVSNAQRQYAQGFVDALRAIQQGEGFKYDSHLASPSLFTPLIHQEFLHSPLLSPQNHRDIASVLRSLMVPGQATPSTATAPSLIGSMSDERLQVPPPSLPTSVPRSLPQPLPQLIQPCAASTAAALSALPSLAHLNLPAQTLRLYSSAEPCSSSAPSVPSTLSSMPPVPSVTLEFPTQPSALNGFPPVKPEVKMESVVPAPRSLSVESADMSDRSSSTGPSNGGGRILSRGNMDEMSMDDQDRRKLERKRLRNRMAASKCRQKKLERIADLEQQVNEEKLKSQRLDSDLDQMRAILDDLQRKVSMHHQKGCGGGVFHKVSNGV